MNDSGGNFVDETIEMVSETVANPGSELRKRRSTRIVQAVPLVVTGVDALGRPFVERTSSLIINCHGCRYQSKHYVLKNMWVSLEVPHPETGQLPRTVRGRVAWIQRPRTPGRRRPLDRPPRGAGTKALLRKDRGLLSGPGSVARAVLLRRGVFGRSRPGQQGPSRLAVEGPARLPIRRHDAHHARHSGESSSLSAGLQPEAGRGLPDRTRRSPYLARVPCHFASCDP